MPPRQGGSVRLLVAAGLATQATALAIGQLGKWEQLSSVIKEDVVVLRDIANALEVFYKADDPRKDDIRISYAATEFKFTYGSLSAQNRYITNGAIVALPSDPDDPSKAFIPSQGFVWMPSSATGDVETQSAQRLCTPLEALNCGLSSMVRTILASAGLMVIMPDTEGLGLSDTAPFHPYIIARPYGTDVVDMLKALSSALKEGKIVPNQPHDTRVDYFLAGYSEGGYSALAVHRHLDTVHKSDTVGNFRHVGTFPCGGPLDVMHHTDWALQRLTTYQLPWAVPYQLVGALYASNLLPRIGDVVVKPWDTRLPELYGGSFMTAAVSKEIPKDVSSIFQPAFVRRFQMKVARSENASLPALNPPADGAEEMADRMTDFLIEESDLIGDSWVPDRLVLVCHGKTDKTVPISAATRAVEHLNSMLPASQAVQTFYTPGNHTFAAVECFGELYAWPSF